MKYLQITLAMLLVVAFWALAQDVTSEESTSTSEPAASSESNDATDEPLTALVVSVEGSAEHTIANGSDELTWTAIESGDTLEERSLIRTGLGATVVLKFSDRGDVIVRGATKCGIASFRKEEGTEKVKVRMGLKYGYLNAKVDASKGKNDFQVATPVGTLAAKGSQVSVGFTTLGLGVNGQAGFWSVNTQQGNSQVGAGQQTDEKGTPDNQLADADRDTKTGDPFGQTDTESWNLINNGGGRGVFNFTGSFQGGRVTPNPVSGSRNLLRTDTSPQPDTVSQSVSLSVAFSRTDRSGSRHAWTWRRVRWPDGRTRSSDRRSRVIV